MTELLQAPEYLSPSSISTYEQCPLKFKYSRIDKLEEPPTEATLRGNFVHDVLEAMYMLPHDSRNLQTAKILSAEIWASEWESKVAAIVPDGELRQFRWSSWWCIENLFKLEEPSNISPAGLEFEVQTSIAGVNIRGFIDRYSLDSDGFITVSDYKTGKTPNKRYMDGKFFQLQLYATALNTLDIGETNKLELLYLKDGVRLSSSMTATDYHDTTQVIVRTKELIDADCSAGSFEPNPSKLCDWCNFKRICPAWKK